MFGSIKFNVVFESTFIKAVINATEDRGFKTKNIPLHKEDNSNMIIINAIRQICLAKNLYMHKGSVCTLYSVVLL